MGWPRGSHLIAISIEPLDRVPNIQDLGVELGVDGPGEAAASADAQ